MSDPRWSRIESIFERALEHPRTHRAEWLVSECGDDGALRGEVEQLLRAHERHGLLDLSPRAHVPLEHRLARALEGRYTFERELGTGGMATVFLAHEAKHERRVVIKVLDPELAAWWGGDRFLREIRIAARLAHPHIVGLIDSGDADGLLYYVMPFIEGDTLRARMDRVNPLPYAQALILLKDIASALAHAHAGGIIHRDLKPSNILCAGDHAFLMDFGIAKLLEPGTGEWKQLTGLGVAIGTPAYMAPEQVRGDAEVDQRTDIYAWGLLALEMLTGRLPSTEQLAATGQRTTIFVRRAGIPRSLERLIERCLASDPAGRPSDAGEIVAELARLTTGDFRILDGARAAPPTGRSRAVIIGAALTLLAVFSAGVWRSRTIAQGAPGVPSPIAVAALSNETGDPALDYWGRMAGDWITQGLQETGLVRVVPWPSALQASEHALVERAAGRAGDPVAVLRAETGAATVITGAYYLVNDSLQFRVEVNDARARSVIGAPGTVSAQRDSAHLAIRLLRDRLMGSVAIWQDERFARIPGMTRRPRGSRPTRRSIARSSATRRRTTAAPRR